MVLFWDKVIPVIFLIITVAALSVYAVRMEEGYNRLRGLAKQSEEAGKESLNRREIDNNGGHRSEERDDSRKKHEEFYCLLATRFQYEADRWNVVFFLIAALLGFGWLH